MNYRVILTPEAEEQLQQIQDYIVSKAFPDNARKYVNRLMEALDRIATAPFQGTSREDIGPGFRTTGFERRVTILYAVTDREVIIAGIYHGGQELPAIFRL